MNCEECSSAFNCDNSKCDEGFANTDSTCTGKNIESHHSSNGFTLSNLKQDHLIRTFLLIKDKRTYAICLLKEQPKAWQVKKFMKSWKKETLKWKLESTKSEPS